MVKLYPTVPVGGVTVPGIPAQLGEDGQPVPMEVDADRAAELMAYQPPAWTTNADGSPTDEQLGHEAKAFEAAWGKDHPKPDHLLGVELPKKKALGSLTMPELHVQAAARGLSTEGKKAEILERIKQHDEAAANGESTEANS